MPTVAALPLVVGETAYCVWDSELKKKNRAFLAGVDPSYYAYVAAVNAPLLDGEHAQHAALAIRAAYGQALETFFALLGASIQAPSCAVAWMLLYDFGDLRWLVQRLVDGQPVRTLLRGGDTSWAGISAAVHARFTGDDPAALQRIKDAYAALWPRLAADFLDPYAQREYNSIKHGLRARAIGSMLQIALPGPDGAAPGSEAFETLADSRHGGAFYVAEKIPDAKGNYLLWHCHRHWTPAYLVAGLQVLANSIHNVVTALRVEVAGEPPEDLSFLAPADAAAFTEAGKVGWGFRINTGSAVDSTRIQPCSAEQVFAAYDAAMTPPRPP